MNASHQRANFAANLKWLCSQRESIAEVCRTTGINRQQFNRYLAGTSVPSALIMRRICALFGVPEELMLQSPGQLARHMAGGLQPEGLISLLKGVGAQSPDIEPGYYFRYQSTSLPGPARVLRTLYIVRESSGCFSFRACRSLYEAGKPLRRLRRHRMFGSIVGIAKLVYFFEADIPFGEGMSLTIYGRPALGSSQLRAGLALQSCPLKRGAMRAALEFLGTKVNLRKAVLGCGYLDVDSPEINPAVLRLILPQPGEAKATLDAHPQILL